MRQLGRVAFKKILIALLPAFERQTDLVGLEQRLEFGIVVVAQRRYVDHDVATLGFPVAADERESRIAAHHFAVIGIENAAARAVQRVHLDFVKSLQHLTQSRYRLHRDLRIPGFAGLASSTPSVSSLRLW